MKGTVSPGTGRRYPLTMICATWRVPRSSVYVTVTAPPAGPPPGKRGPKTPTTDAAVVAAIREVLAATPFHGEGYRKVRARLAHRGLPDPAHDGRITTDAPDIMGGTDATRFYTEQAGWCWFFGAIDHGIDELLGWHVVKLGDRWAALDPSARASATPSATSGRTSPAGSQSAATGARNTSPTRGSTR